MSRFLQRFNFLGVIALAVLCVVQWRAHRQLNLEINRREQARLDQSAVLEERSKTSSGQSNDLVDLRVHLTRVSAELKTTVDRLAATDRELQQAASQRDQLQSSVSNWAAAVTARDARLEETARELKLLAGERHAAVTQFNDLAARYNKLVKDFNDVQLRLAATLTNAAPLPREP